MIYDEDDVSIIRSLLVEIADTKIKKTEEMIDSASHSNNEGETSFLAGGIDALSAVEQMIDDIVTDLKAKRDIA